MADFMTPKITYQCKMSHNFMNNHNYGSVALLSHLAKRKNRKCENKKCKKTSMAQNV